MALTWHSVTVIPQSNPLVPVPVDGFVEAEDDLALAVALNFIQVNEGGTVLAVLPCTGLLAVMDELGLGHYHWVRIIYTTGEETHTASTPVSVAVGTTSVPLVAANVNRKGLLITVVTQNNRVSLGFDTPALLDRGVMLIGGKTDVFEMNEFTFTTAAINAIASNGNTIVAVQEFT